MPIAIMIEGRGAKGALSYLDSGHNGAQPGKVSAWESGNVFGEDWRDWALCMRIQAAEAPNVKKPYLHLIVSLDPKDPAQKLDDPQLVDLARDYLTRLKLAEHQYVIAVHRDTEHAHAHMVVNRIGDDGKAYPMWKFKERSWEALRTMEAERGMRSPAQEQSIEISREALGQTERQGKPTWKVQLQGCVDAAVRDSGGGWETFLGKLHELGVDAQVTPNGRGMTFRLVHEQNAEGKPVAFKASALGKGYRLTALQERVANQPRIDRASRTSQPQQKAASGDVQQPSLTALVRAGNDHLAALAASTAISKNALRSLRDDPVMDAAAYERAVGRYLAVNAPKYAYLKNPDVRQRRAEADFRHDILGRVQWPTRLEQESLKLESARRHNRPYQEPEKGFEGAYERLIHRSVAQAERLAESVHSTPTADGQAVRAAARIHRGATAISDAMQGKAPTGILPFGRLIASAQGTRQILASLRDSTSAAHLAKTVSLNGIKSQVLQRLIVASGPAAPVVAAGLAAYNITSAFAVFMKTDQERQREAERERER